MLVVRLAWSILILKIQVMEMESFSMELMSIKGIVHNMLKSNKGCQINAIKIKHSQHRNQGLLDNNIGTVRILIKEQLFPSLPILNHQVLFKDTNLHSK